jgi:hypothetical protein
MGIEPTFEAWEAPVLPLNYTRDKCLIYRDSHHCVMGVLRAISPGELVEPACGARQAPVSPWNYAGITAEDQQFTFVNANPSPPDVGGIMVAGATGDRCIHHRQSCPSQLQAGGFVRKRAETPVMARKKWQVNADGRQTRWAHRRPGCGALGSWNLRMTRVFACGFTRNSWVMLFDMREFA